MEKILFGILIIFILWAVIATARLWCYRRQMQHLLKELELLEQTDAKGLLTSAFPIGKTEEVISSVNRVIEKNRWKAEQLFKENRSYRESITGISHDIRTPLTSVKGYVQMLSNPMVTEKKKEEYIKVVEMRLEDLTDLLDQLFEYTRLEAGEMKLEPEKLNVCNLFAEAVSMFYDDFVKKGCEPEVIIPQKPCHISADQRALERIIENLIKNALVHGTGDYRLFLSQEENHVILGVSNRTESIERQDMERIFDRFYTTDQSRSRKTTGLGLAIVKEFTSQMGGRAEASLDGKIFTITVTFECCPNERQKVKQ